jgi:TATA element modulatory factor
MFTNFFSNLADVVQSTVDEIVQGDKIEDQALKLSNPTTQTDAAPEIGQGFLSTLDKSPASKGPVSPSSLSSSVSIPTSTPSSSISTRVNTQSTISSDVEGWSSIDLGSEWETVKKQPVAKASIQIKKETLSALPTTPTAVANTAKTLSTTSTISTPLTLESVKSVSTMDPTLENTNSTKIDDIASLISSKSEVSVSTSTERTNKTSEISSTPLAIVTISSSPITSTTSVESLPSSSTVSALSALQAEFAALQEKNLLLQARSSAFEALVSSREGQLASLSAQAARSMEEANAFREQVEAGKGRLANSITQLEEERKKLKSMSREKEVLNEQLSEMNQKVTEALSVAESRQKELLEKDNKIADILSEGEGLSRKVAASEATIKSLRSNIRTVEADRDARKEELASAEATLSLLKSRVEELETLVAATSRDKESVSGMANASQQMLTALEDEAVKLRSENKALKTNISSVQRELEEGKVQISRALGEAQTSEREKEILEAALQTSQSAEASASRLASGLEDQLRDLRRQLSAAQTSMGQREDDLRSALDEMTSRWQKAASAAEDGGLTALAQAYGASVMSSLSSQSTTSGSSQSRPAVEAIIQQLAAAQSELQTRRETWAAQRTSLQSRLEAAEAAADKAESEAKRAESSSADATAALTAIRTELLALRSAKGRVDSDSAVLADRLRESESRLISLSSSLDAANLRVTELSSVTSDLRSRLDEAAGARSASAHVLGLLRDQLSKATSDLETKTREIAELQDTLSRINSKSSSSPSTVTRETSSVYVNLSTPGAVGWLETALGKSSTQISDGSLLSSTSVSTPLFTSPVNIASTTSFVNGMNSAPSPHPSFLQMSMAEADLEREKLTEAVVELSARVKKYEGLETVCSTLKTQLADAISRHDVMLELLGEREEELEDLRADIEEIKTSFRHQLNEAMNISLKTDDQK